MTAEQLKKLRAYYYSLVGMQPTLEATSKASELILRESALLVQEEFDRISADFPNLIPSVNLSRHQMRQDPQWYYSQGVLSELALVIGRLKVAIETVEGTPVTETRQFAFVKDQNLRQVLERDYGEIQKAYIATCWKSVIILSGGAFEAILADLLLQNQAKAKASAKAPSVGDITKWDLVDLINVSVDLKLVSPGVEKLSHPVREYRNLVHPGNEVRNKLTFGKEEARIAIEVLHMLHRDLSP